MANVAGQVQGLLDTALSAVPHARVREGQRAMAEAVGRAMREHEHLLVQAGTGTGKSLAYLVPALASGKRVVIATATKALQAQLVDKDLPRSVGALAEQLGRRPSYALAKGRSNYVCLQQLHAGPGAVEEPDGLFDTPNSMLGTQVVRLREWAAQSTSGDRDEVPFPVPDRAWRQVSVAARDCLGGRCPDRLDCFSEQAREAAQAADIVVANHALLAVDALTDVSVLPEHDAVVLDEAHQFVNSATEALSHELSRTDLRRAITASASGLDDAAQGRLQDAASSLDGLLAVLTPGRLRGWDEHSSLVLAAVQESCASAAGMLGRAGELDETEQVQRERAKAALWAVAESAGELRAPSVSSARYAVGESGSVRLRVSPLSVASAVAEHLFGRCTVVATSATLTLGGSFAHTACSWGLPVGQGVEVGTAFTAEAGADEQQGPPLRWRYSDVGSPFNYARQGQLYVATDLPAPKNPSWPSAVDARLAELIEAAGGRTLALFSSMAAAVRAASHIRAVLPEVPVLLQGEDTAGALTHRFVADARTCLFGTRTFWQGVDAPGSACQLVVIDRIPFAHIDDPLTQARFEAAGAAGFAAVTLPPAAVLLAQGVGRLIRSTQDRGVVAVLDPRLATASYAGTLLRTLPAFYRTHSLAGVLRSLAAIDAAAPEIDDPPAPSSARAGAPGSLS